MNPSSAGKQRSFVDLFEDYAGICGGTLHPGRQD